MEKKIFHFSTDGNKIGRLFIDDRDFIGTMNDIATIWVQFNTVEPTKSANGKSFMKHIKVKGLRIIIHCFILMDNHIHIVLEGSEEDCEAFMRMLVMKIAKRMRINHGEVRIGSQIIYSKKEVDSLDYYLRCIAYDCRNSLDKRVLPLYYRWSSSSLYFNDMRDADACIKRRDLIVSKYQRMCMTRKEIPEDWLITDDGLIHPSNYVNFREVEERFGSVGRFMGMMGRKVEKDADFIDGGSLSDLMTDRELETSALKIAMMEFNVKGLFQLTKNEEMKLAIELRRVFGAGKDQVARILGLTDDIIARL